jgi:Icc protein
MSWGLPVSGRIVTLDAGSMAMMRLVQITDIHYMAEAHQLLYDSFDTDRTLEGVLELVDSWQPDRIVITGDLSQQGDAASYHRLQKRLSRLTVPVDLMPGNHDHAATLAKVLVGNNLYRQPMVNLGRWAAVYLDSSVDGQPHGRLVEADLKQLDHCLEQAGDRHVLVFLHHPPLPVGSAWLDEMILTNPEPLFERILGTGVRAVICGHVHQEFAGECQGLPVLTTPSTCFQVTPDCDQMVEDQQGPGFRWFELADDGQWNTGIQRLEQSARACSAS